MDLSLEQQLELLYDAAFNRMPDATGFAWNLALLQSGEIDLYQMADSFAASEEFSNVRIDTGHIPVLVETYDFRLDRSPSIPEMEAWNTVAMNEGLDNGGVLVGIALSPESIVDIA